MPENQQAASDYTPQLMARLAGVLTPLQLELFVKSCEQVKQAGGGWGDVLIIFKNGTADEVEGRFTKKMRDDSGWLKH
jgi:hypothetical protein